MSSQSDNHCTNSIERAAPTAQTTDRPTPAQDVRVVAAGVDTVYASVKGEVNSDRLDAALRVRGRAQEGSEAEPWEIPGVGRTFLVQPHAQRGYAVRLNAPSLDVWVGYEGNSQRPSIYLELRSAGIHAAGVEDAVADAQAVAEWFCPQLTGLPAGAGLTISRIDLYADVQGWSPSQQDDERFVCRAKYVSNYDAEIPGDGQPRSRRRVGRVFSGFSFGRGRVAARIYDKTLQMQAKGDDWQREVWQNADPDLPVWRVEVQYRRAVLTDFLLDDHTNLTTAADALAHRQELWDYGVRDWLTLRRPNGDSHRSRWPLDPMWLVIQGATIGSPSSPLVRERVKNATLQRLLQGMTGYLTSLVAHDSSEGLRETIRIIDAAMATGTVEDRERAVRMALEGMAPAVASYCDRRQRRFVAVVDAKTRKNDAA